MREQPVVAHTDTQARSHPPQNYRDKERFPGEEKQRGDRAQVKQHHKRGRDPIHFVTLCRPSFQIGEFNSHFLGPFFQSLIFDLRSLCSMRVPLELDYQ
jgi:hypothetical protein